MDLASAWLLLDPGHHGAVRDRVDVDDDTWRRGRAWGIHLAAALLTIPDDDVLQRVGRQALARIATELDGGRP